MLFFSMHGCCLLQEAYASAHGLATAQADQPHEVCYAQLFPCSERDAVVCTIGSLHNSLHVPPSAACCLVQPSSRRLKKALRESCIIRLTESLPPHSATCISSLLCIVCETGWVSMLFPPARSADATLGWCICSTTFICSTSFSALAHELINCHGSWPQ